MIAVGSDDGVLLGDGRFHTDGEGLLAVVEVAEAADELGLVKGVGCDLHTAHEAHIVEEGEKLRRRRGDGSGRGIAVVAGKGNACLNH